MSDTESFEHAMAEMRKVVMDCDMERCDMYDGDCYKCQYDILDRMQRAHERELEHLRKAEYARGYHDGQHSMDAEHYAVALRLMHLPLDGGSHENLSQIARAVYHADFGWTQGACKALRDELVRLMGGVHEPSSFAKSGDFGKLEDDGHGEIDKDCQIHQTTTPYDVLGNERHKAVCELKKIQTDAGGFVKALANALGVGWQAPRVSQTIAEVRDRLIHLLGGDEPFPNFSEPNLPKSAKIAKPESEDGGEVTITDELREKIHEKVNQELYVVVEADDLYAIADRIDEQFNRICEQQEAVLQQTIDEMAEERDKLRTMLTQQRYEARAKVLKLESENAEWRRGAERDADKLESLTGAYNDAAAERDELQRELEHTKKSLDGMREQREHWADEAIEMFRVFFPHDEYCVPNSPSKMVVPKINEMQKKLDELEKFDHDTSLAAFGDDNEELRKLLSRAAKLLVNAEQDRDANYAYWMDCKEKVVHANVTIDELQAKLNAILEAVNAV